MQKARRHSDLHRNSDRL